MRAWILLSIPLGLALSFSGDDGRGVKPKRAPLQQSQALSASIDSRLSARWVEQGVQPALGVDELTLARRLWLDLLGTIPSLAELRALERVPEPERRAWLLERAFTDPRFDAVLAERLARIAVGGRDTKQDDLLYRRGRLVTWLTAQVRQNRPWDELVRELLTAEGLSTDAPAVNFAVSQDVDPVKLAARTTRAFLGVRIDSAQCHDHPFTRWKQRDFEGLAAFFARTERQIGGVRDQSKGELEFQLPGAAAGMGMGVAMGSMAPDDQAHREAKEQEQDWPQDGEEPKDGEAPQDDEEDDDEKLVRAPFGQPVRVVRDPKQPLDPAIETRTVQPRVPLAPELLPAIEGRRGRRRALAAWVTHPDNPFFARALVNRFWLWLMGRGLVEPVDELDSSAPRDEVLLELLARDFRRSGYDLRHLIRAIVGTRAYALSSAQAEGAGEAEGALEAMALRPLKALRGDQLASAVLQSTSFRAYDEQRAPLLRLAFWGGRNGFVERHADDLALEEPEEETLLQRLHLLNGDQVTERTKADDPFGTAQRLALLAPDDEVALDAAFLATLTRRPSPAERDYFGGLLAEVEGDNGKRAEVLADLLWCLLNTTEFAWSR
ncbi:MAG TPA: hypothetical protein DEA08_19185 [Planctomycetes bacterium]|nr:hypothetical protein [Planctomycetota bacterium]